MVATWFPPVLNGLLSVIGVPGNYLVIRIFSKRHPHLPVHTLVIGLALSDLLVCLCRMVIFYMLIAVDPVVQRDVAIIRCRISDASLYFSIYVSLFLLTQIAADRHTAFHIPRGFRRRSVNPWKTKFAILLSATIAMILACALPMVGEYKLLEHDDEYRCRIVSPDWLTDLRLFSLLGATAVAVLTTFWLYVALFRAVRRRARVSVEAHSRSCMSLISVATRVSLMLPHSFPSSDLRPHPSLAATSAPPRIFVTVCDVKNRATTSFQRDENGRSVSPKDASHLSIKSRAAGRKREIRDKKPRVKFDDLQTRARCREYQLAELLRYPRRPTTNQFNSSIARMALAKSLLFSVTWIPAMLLQTVHHFSHAGLVNQPDDTRLNVALNLVLIHSAVTILIFLLVSRRFREVFRELFHGIRCFWEPRCERAFHPSYLNRYSK